MSMDIQGNLTKIPLSENAILHQSGVSFFRIFTAYRKEKKIRTEKIVSGVISRRAFLDIEKGKSGEELYKLSKDAVCCTVQEDWKENLSALYVGPEELEAMLLVVWSLLKKNELMDAFRLFDQIQRYPKIHNWEPRMREMICAQIALIGIKLQ